MCGRGLVVTSSPICWWESNRQPADDNKGHEDDQHRSAVKKLKHNFICFWHHRCRRIQLRFPQSTAAAGCCIHDNTLSPAWVKEETPSSPPLQLHGGISSPNLAQWAAFFASNRIWTQKRHNNNNNNNKQCCIKYKQRDKNIMLKHYFGKSERHPIK